MRYNEIVPAIFKKRVNRFIAEVWLNGELERVHVKNTGRLKELLLPEREVYLEIADNPNRKTKYSLIAVNRDGNLVNVDSQAQNIAAFEAIQSGKIKEIGKPEFLKKEVTFQSSRFDLYFEDGDTKGFIEVKGVTLSKRWSGDVSGCADITRGEAYKRAGKGCSGWVSSPCPFYCPDERKPCVYTELGNGPCLFGKFGAGRKIWS